MLAAADPGVSGFALDLSNEVPGLQRCLEACTANNAFAGDADFPPRKTKEFGVVGVEAKDPAARSGACSSVGEAPETMRRPQNFV